VEVKKLADSEAQKHLQKGDGGEGSFGVEVAASHHV
jgi:hypothetical protein